MTPHRELLCEYEKYNGGDVHLGDGSLANIIGCGRFKIKLKDGRIRTLPRVIHIPNIEINLISVRKMDVAGVKTMCGDGGCKMVWGSMVFMRGFWYGTLYKLLERTTIDECSISVVLEEGGKDDRTLTTLEGKTMLWNQILGHIGEKGVPNLQGRGMVEGMTDYTLDFDFFEHCIYRKKLSNICIWCYKRKGNSLELVHSDLFGLVHAPSLSGYVYYVSFIDDFSRNT